MFLRKSKHKQSRISPRDYMINSIWGVLQSICGWKSLIFSTKFGKFPVNSNKSRNLYQSSKCTSKCRDVFVWNVYENIIYNKLILKPFILDYTEVNKRPCKFVKFKI